PTRLHFAVYVNNAQVAASCDTLVTFTNSGFVATAMGAGSGARASGAATYAVRMAIQSDGPNNNPKGARELVVDLSGTASTTTTPPSRPPAPTPTTPPLPGCTPGDAVGPVVSLPAPAAGTRYPFPTAYPVDFTATATDPSGVSLVRYLFIVNQASPPFAGTAN